MAALDLQRMLDWLKQDEAGEVIAALEPVVEDMPAHLTAHVLLARAYEAHERWGDALQAWQQARFLFPNSPAVADGIRRVLKAREEAPLVASESASAPPPSEAAEASASSTPSDEAASSERPESGRASSAPPELRHLAEREPIASPDESMGELDRLIQELESARIEPDPDLDSIPAPDLDDDIDDVVSETLARIYTSQEQYGEAARVYVKLATQEPDRAEEHLEKAAELRARADEQE